MIFMVDSGFCDCIVFQTLENNPVITQQYLFLIPYNWPLCGNPQSPLPPPCLPLLKRFNIKI